MAFLKHQESGVNSLLIQIQTYQATNLSTQK